MDDILSIEELALLEGAHRCEGAHLTRLIRSHELLRAERNFAHRQVWLLNQQVADLVREPSTPKPQGEPEGAAR